MLALASPYCQHIDTRCEPSQSCGKLVLHIRSPMRIGNETACPGLRSASLASYRLGSESKLCTAACAYR